MRNNIPTILVYAFTAALASLISLFGSIVTSQRRATDVELLARITVHETGWEDTGDMEAIYAVLREGAAREDISWRAFLGRYSSRLVSGDVDRAWAAELTESCERPPSWPTTAYARLRDGTMVLRPHASWSAYSERCRAVMERAREVLAGERADGCERPPHDWGGRVDRDRARRLGLIEVDCSLGDVETIGDYYVRPSLIDVEAP